jgi:hypothetical protein
MIPEGNLIGIYSPNDIPTVVDIQQDVIWAINNPIGTDRLYNLAKGKQNVIIVADDNTHLTPNGQDHGTSIWVNRRAYYREDPYAECKGDRSYLGLVDNPVRVEISQEADIVIASSHPCDLEFN